MHMIDNKMEIALTFIHDLFPMGKQVRKIKKKETYFQKISNLEEKSEQSKNGEGFFFYLDRGYKKIKPVSQKVN